MNGVERMHSILLVDDEPTIIRLMAGYLEKEGFSIEVARDGSTAVQKASLLNPSLIVLDVMLPELDGWEVCRRIRQHSDVPILMLTARSDETDKIVGLSIGADDYLTKPFSPRELVARVKALLRRSTMRLAEKRTEWISVHELTLDLKAMTVTKRGESIHLTAIEYQLLKIMASHPGQVFTKQQLLDLCWGYQFMGDDRLVVVHVGNLRKKLEDDPGNPQYILTVRGTGYCFRKGE